LMKTRYKETRHYCTEHDVIEHIFYTTKIKVLSNTLYIKISTYCVSNEKNLTTILLSQLFGTAINEKAIGGLVASKAPPTSKNHYLN
jgi:hypothetical protein